MRRSSRGQRALATRLLHETAGDEPRRQTMMVCWRRSPRWSVAAPGGTRATHVLFCPRVPSPSAVRRPNICVFGTRRRPNHHRRCPAATTRLKHDDDRRRPSLSLALLHGASHGSSFGVVTVTWNTEADSKASCRKSSASSAALRRRRSRQLCASRPSTFLAPSPALTNRSFLALLENRRRLRVSTRAACSRVLSSPPPTSCGGARARRRERDRRENDDLRSQAVMVYLFI